MVMFVVNFVLYEAIACLFPFFMFCFPFSLLFSLFLFRQYEFFHFTSCYIFFFPPFLFPSLSSLFPSCFLLFFLCPLFSTASIFSPSGDDSSFVFYSNVTRPSCQKAIIGGHRDPRLVSGGEHVKFLVCHNVSTVNSLPLYFLYNLPCL